MTDRVYLFRGTVDDGPVVQREATAIELTRAFGAAWAIRIAASTVGRPVRVEDAGRVYRVWRVL